MNFHLIYSRINYTFVTAKVFQNGKLFNFENPKSFPKKTFIEKNNQKK